MRCRPLRRDAVPVSDPRLTSFLCVLVKFVEFFSSRPFSCIQTCVSFGEREIRVALDPECNNLQQKVTKQTVTLSPSRNL